MPELSQKQRLANALAQTKVDRVPVLSFTQTGTLSLMEATGAYWPKAHREARPMAGLALAGHTIAGLEGVRIPFGLTTEAAAMGCEIDYHEDKNDFTPTVKKGLVNIGDLGVPDPNKGIMGQMLEATRIILDRVGDEVPVIAGVTGPFTLAGHLLGIDNVMKDLVINPSAVREVEDTTWQVVASFSNSLHESGADAITIIEPTASIIGANFFRNFISPYVKKIVAVSKAPIILHVCGNSLPIMDLMAETGAKAISVDQKVSIAKAKAVAKGRTAIFGNVDPVAVLLNGDPNAVLQECQKIIGEGPGALAPGCGLAPHTPLENIKAMVQAGLGSGDRSQID